MSKWNDAKANPPQAAGHYLTVAVVDGRQYVHERYYAEGYGWTTQIPESITHWMPLPEAPEVENG